MIRIKTLKIHNKEYICLENLSRRYKNKVLLYKWVDKKDLIQYIKLLREIKEKI